MIDKDLLGRIAYLNQERLGRVHDFYISKEGGDIPGIIVSMGLLKSQPIRKGLFTFDGRCFIISSKARDSEWKPDRISAVKQSRVRNKEVFAGRGWKIGSLHALDIDTKKWSVAGLHVDIEHQLIMRDVAEYDKLREERAVYGIKHFYKDALSFRPNKIVAEMGDSDKARFLTDSGDSSFRGMGEAISRVVLPPDGMSIHEAGTTSLPIDPLDVQGVAIEMVNQGALKSEDGRRNIVRNIFAEYYRRLG